MKAKITIPVKRVLSVFQGTKGRFALLSTTVLLLTLMMIIPDTSFSLRSPVRMIINPYTKECADLYIGFEIDISKCSPPKGWKYAEYGFADVVCPEGYEHTDQEFELERCGDSYDGDGPRRRPPESSGFGCFW